MDTMIFDQQCSAGRPCKSDLRCDNKIGAIRLAVPEPLIRRETNKQWKEESFERAVADLDDAGSNVSRRNKRH
jgi:hypothetical protein